MPYKHFIFIYFYEFINGVCFSFLDTLTNIDAFSEFILLIEVCDKNMWKNHCCNRQLMTFGAIHTVLGSKSNNATYLFNSYG